MENHFHREYAVMQPLQRSYAITKDRIGAMLSGGALSFLYDEAKVDELALRLFLERTQIYVAMPVL